MRVACGVRVCAALGGPVHTRVLLSDLSRAAGEECPAASSVPPRSWVRIECLEVTEGVPSSAAAWRGALGADRGVEVDDMSWWGLTVEVPRLDDGLYGLVLVQQLVTP